MNAKILIPILIILMLSGCAYKPGLGSYGDAATTAIALSSDSFVEANPIIPSSDPIVAAVVTIGLKQGVKYIISPQYDDEVDSAVEAVGMVATGWNATLLLGGAYAIAAPVGILAGIVYWKYRESKRTEAKEND